MEKYAHFVGAKNVRKKNTDNFTYLISDNFTYLIYKNYCLHLRFNLFVSYLFS